MWHYFYVMVLHTKCSVTLFSGIYTSSSLFLSCSPKLSHIINFPIFLKMTANDSLHLPSGGTSPYSRFGRIDEKVFLLTPDGRNVLCAAFMQTFFFFIAIFFLPSFYWNDSISIFIFFTSFLPSLLQPQSSHWTSNSLFRQRTKTGNLINISIIWTGTFRFARFPRFALSITQYRPDGNGHAFVCFHRQFVFVRLYYVSFCDGFFSTFVSILFRKQLRLAKTNTVPNRFAEWEMCVPSLPPFKHRIVKRPTLSRSGPVFVEQKSRLWISSLPVGDRQYESAAAFEQHQ